MMEYSQAMGLLGIALMVGFGIGLLIGLGIDDGGTAR